MSKNVVGRGAPQAMIDVRDGKGPLGVRFPEGLRDRLKHAAIESRRSLNSEVVARLEASFGDNPVLPGPTPSAVASSLDAQVAAAIERHVQAEVAARLQRIAGALNAGGE